MKRPFKIALICGMALAFLPTPAHAAWEYYTYGGFDAVLPAWQRVALIFSDSGYKALFFTIISMGIFFAGLSFYMKALGGLKAGPLSWALPVGIGIVLYLGLVVPTDSLMIYDPVLNEGPVEVSGIPLGIAAAAGVLNEIQNGLIDIIETSSDPVGYRQNAGGMGFNILQNIGQQPLLIPDWLQASLQQYTKDCLVFELQRPGTTLTVDELANNTDDTPLFAEAANPAIDTVFYSVGDSQGTTMTCQDAWTAIENAIGPDATFDGDINNICAQSGYDPTIPAELQQCKSLATDTSQWIWGSSYTAYNLRRQTTFAQAISQTLMNASPDQAIQVLASKQTGTAMESSGIAGNTWIPVLMAAMTAVAIGILPFLIMFLPTPLFGKVISLVAGMFIWLTTWAVIDAVVHSFAMDYAAHVVQQLRQYNIGQVAINSFATSGLKTLAAFGNLRWGALMFATVITGMLVRFGGSALAHLAGGLTAAAQSGGAAAGQMEVDPKTHGGELSGQVSGAATTMAYGNQDLRDIMDSSFMQKTKSIGGGELLSTASGEYMAAHPGASPKEMSEFLAAGGMNPASSVGLARGGYSLDNVLGASTTEQTRKITDAQRFKTAADGYGGVAAFAGALATKNYAQAAQVIDSYAKDKGVSFDQASSEIGKVLGDREALGGEAFGLVQGTVGRKEQLFAEANKGLSGAARFEQTYQFAKSAGYAGSREDFKGIYEAHEASESQVAWTLDQKRADWLNQKMEAQGLAARFQAGERVTMARTEDGAITLATGEGGASNEALDVSRLTKGGFEHVAMTSGELKEFAGELRADGLVSASKGLLAIAAKENGADLNITRDKDGNVVSMSAKAGGDTTWKDFSLGQKGWEHVTKALDKVQMGTRVETGDKAIDYDVNERQIGAGTIIDSTAFQMALKGDHALVHQVTNPYLNGAAQDAEMAALVAPLAKAANEFAARDGVSFDYTRGEAQLSVGAGGGLIFKANMGASGSIGGQRTDQEKTNLIAQEYETIARRDIAKAREEGLSWKETENLLSNDLQAYTIAFQKNVEANSPIKYGVSSVGAALEGAKKKLDSANIPENPIIKDDARGDIDSQ